MKNCVCKKKNYYGVDYPGVFFQSCRMFANQSFQKVIREIVKILGTKELERQTKSVEPKRSYT